jgi:hypothetical protein
MIPIQIEPEIIKKEFLLESQYCVFVKIEGREYDVCEETSKVWWSSSKSGAYGKGLLNSKDDPAKTERIGLLGQMAFAKLINEPVDLSYRHGGDKYDFLISGKYKIDIKCASWDYGKNLVQKTNEYGYPQKIDKHIYVGSFIDQEDRSNKNASIVLVGYYLKEDVLCANTAKGSKGNGHFNYELQFHRMKPIMKLIDKIKNYKLNSQVSPCKEPK